MSKIGKMPIIIPNGVTVSIQDTHVEVTGPKGKMSHTIPAKIAATVEDGKVLVTTEHQEDKIVRALYGLTRALIANLVKGVDSGFEKKLELVGVGYRAQMQGTSLVLSLGFSHPVKITPLDGISIAVADNTKVTVSGIDKMLVGQTAAQIRAVRPPEPYKGKGIRYAGEKVRRKAGKAAKAGTK